MRTETTRRRRPKKPLARKTPPRKRAAAPERGRDDDDLTPLADELVVQGDRGFDEWSGPVERDPEATPW